MVSASHIPGFLDQPFLQNKSVKQCNYLHFDTKSQKLKVKIFWLGMVKKGCSQSCLWTLIDCIPRVN